MTAPNIHTDPNPGTDPVLYIMKLLEEIKGAVRTTNELGAITLLNPRDTEVVIKKIRETFAIESSAVLWHKFSSPYAQLDAEGDEEVQAIIEEKFKSYDLVYLVIEDETYYALDLAPSLVLAFLSECRYVVYYVVDKKFETLLCENDHNQIFLIRTRV